MKKRMGRVYKYTCFVAIIFILSLFCFSVNVVSEKTETKLRGQSSAAKWGLIKKGWKKVKTTVKKVAKHVKKKANKVKIVFQERVLGKMRTIKDKFVLASAGGGSRAVSGSGKKTRMKKKRHNKLLYKNRFYRNRYKKKYRPSMMQQKRSK